MTTEAFEQAKRVLENGIWLLAKWIEGSRVIGDPALDDLLRLDDIRKATYTDLRIKIGFSEAAIASNIVVLKDILDLTALLEQHKEMMLREELMAYEEWKHPSRPIMLIEDKVFEYLKNEKKL